MTLKGIITHYVGICKSRLMYPILILIQKINCALRFIRRNRTYSKYYIRRRYVAFVSITITFCRCIENGPRTAQDLLGLLLPIHTYFMLQKFDGML